MSEQEITELIDTLATPPPAKPRAPRQGLPAEYRMRHEAHYVEELGAAPRPAAGDTAPERSQPPVEIAAALRDLCREFEGLASCFNLIEQSARPLRERMGLRLAKIGVQRSIRYAQQLRVLLEEPRAFQRDVSLDHAIREALDEFKDELRLIEATLVMDAPTSSLIISGDPHLLRAALSACAGVMIGLIELGGRPTELQVSAFRADEKLHCEFRQESFQLEDKPSRALAVALAAARRIAELQGGSLTTRPTSGGGTALLLSFA
jgi:hypothetical protein